MTKIKHKDFIYDLEVYPNFFSMSAIYKTGSKKVQFEISDRKDQLPELLEFLRNCIRTKCRMVAFNNIGFDYPLLHFIIEKARSAAKVEKQAKVTAKQIYNEMLKMFEKKPDDRFGSRIKTEDTVIPQVDLYLINHFDNRARSTSLKMLEFNMRSDNIQELPFAVGTVLTHEQMDIVLKYNMHDVTETLKFYNYCQEALQLRDDLSVEFGFDCTNFNDGKIGKQLFITSLEKERPGACYTQTERGRKINQTKRSSIKIKDCLVPYVKFERPEFQALHQWFQNRVIIETKGVFSDIDEAELGDLAKYCNMITKQKRFKQKPTEQELSEFMSEHPKGWIKEEELKATEWVFDENGEHVMYQPLDEFGEPKGKPKKQRKQKVSYWGCWNEAEGLNVVVNGLQYNYGTGGLHMSVEGSSIISDDDYSIIDADVSSMYPNVAIVNEFYPEHLGKTFCKVYSDLYNKRKSAPKGTAMNAALKLSLNSVYGDSNNEYSPLYDPQYTMSVTLTGQMMLTMLVEKFISIDAEIIQCNTDGVTVRIHNSKMGDYCEKCKEWELMSKLNLEYASYSKMFIKDVNSYIAVYKE